jgi:cysteine synthase
MLYRDITELIGNTPLLRLDPARHGIEGIELYAKLESANPFGSVKDRIAWGMIRSDLGEIIRHGPRGTRRAGTARRRTGRTPRALRMP